MYEKVRDASGYGIPKIRATKCAAQNLLLNICKGQLMRNRVTFLADIVMRSVFFNAAIG